MILVDPHLYRRSLTLSILQMRSVHRSWDFEIGVHFDDSRRLDFESGYEESRSVGCVLDYAIGDEGSEIGLSVYGQNIDAPM